MNKKVRFSVGVTLSTVVTTTTLGLFDSSVSALTLTSSSGSWSNLVMVDEDDTFLGIANPGSNTLNVDFSNNESKVEWGEPFPRGSDEKSGLEFTRVTNQDFQIGGEFLIGTLTHFNNPVTQPFASAADLTVNLSFSDPAISPSFTFTFDINETLNSKNGIPIPPALCDPPSELTPPVPCPDVISFPSSFPSQSFTIDGQDFTLELLGFRNIENETPQLNFVSEEKETNSAELFGRITAVEKTPEPTTVLALGLVGIYFFSYRRGQRTKG